MIRKYLLLHKIQVIINHCFIIPIKWFQPSVGFPRDRSHNFLKLLLFFLITRVGVRLEIIRRVGNIPLIRIIQLDS